MKASELRINNWYYSVKFNIPVQCELTDFSQLDVMSDGAYNDPPIEEMFEPIPLTEEWLLKFGFTDNEYTFDLKANKKILSFGWSSRVVSTGYRSGLSCKKYRHVKYVHQLQNLYFALTGEERTIN